MIKLLDSTFLIDYLRGEQSAIAFAKRSQDRLATTEINVFEVVTGFHRHRGANARRSIEIAEDYFRTLSVFPLDHAPALLAANIAGMLSKKGVPVDFADCLIAGIALQNGCEAIVTRNLKDFSKIPDLRVEPY